MPNIVKLNDFRRHARASRVRAEHAATKASSVMSGRPRSAAADVRADQYSTGIEPRVFQLLTVEGKAPQSRATSPVPPSAKMIASTSIAAHDNSRGVKMSSVHKTKEYAAAAACQNFDMTDDAIAIKRRLRLAQIALLRLEKIESAAQLVKKLHLKHSSQWSQYINPDNKRQITLDAARKLRRHYSISLDWLYENDWDKLPQDIKDVILAVEVENPGAQIVNTRGRPRTTRNSRRVKKKA